MNQSADMAATAVTEPILVPIDLSDSAGGILSMAGELAGCLGKPLVVMHVLHDSPEEPGQYHGSDTQAIPMSEVARRKLDGLIADLVERRPDLQYLEEAEVVLFKGLPANRILEVTEHKRPKMIVMGSHGRNGVSRALMGSVAETVMRASRVPVTIVKSATHA